MKMLTLFLISPDSDDRHRRGHEPQAPRRGRGRGVEPGAGRQARPQAGKVWLFVDFFAHLVKCADIITFS